MGNYKSCRKENMNSKPSEEEKIKSLVEIKLSKKPEIVKF